MPKLFALLLLLAMAVPKAPRKRFGSIQQAAVEANVCDKTIRRWIAQGRLTAYRVGPRLIRVDLDELEASFRQIGGGAA
ncbi:helix-turn-helix domain-containing protein [Mycobacterium pseudokansasii]|uniref:helix-turn-helix domain-containing protein n=1 Tax=Mycobacterium pseudokansasii TaxID=2341080 RepID=UPI001FCE9DED|nr:helix-turn-helix domain-containing protein [Mycobacterium pseudokansasii]